MLADPAPTNQAHHTPAICGHSNSIVLDSYPGPLEQIVANLVLNSLTHAFVEEQSGEIHIAGHSTGQEAVIEYRDNGRGMEPGEATHAFDPFFTTRLGTGGSGLGLYITATWPAMYSAARSLWRRRQARGFVSP